MADSTTHITQLEASQSQKEVTANGLFDAASYAMAYGRHAETCSGLTWGYYGTRYGGDEIANGTNLCDASETTYMMVELATGAVVFSNEGSDSDPDWDDPLYGRCYIITTDADSVTDYEDHRFGPRGIFSGAATSGLDASQVTYTPTTVADWQTSTDPGNVDDALDELAERITDAELAAVSGGSSTVTAVTSSSNTVTLNCALGDYFTFALSENVTTISFSNLPGSGKGASKFIRITQDSTPRTVAWPASFKWAGAVAGVVSTGSGAVDLLAITTPDNGTTWLATLAKAFA